MIIDGKNLILGRLATFVAKKALQGEPIEIINSEQVFVTGDKKKVFAEYKRKRERGSPLTGPFIPRQPDRLLKRTIRGMLPYKQPRGQKAFKSIKCHAGVPDELKDKKPETVPSASMEKLTITKYISLGEICKNLGGKI